MPNENYSQDYWTNGKECFWLTNTRYSQQNTHGAGCTLSAAIAASLALGYTLKDALVIAKMYVSRAIRLANQFGNGPLATLFHQHWPDDPLDLPKLSLTPTVPKKKFPTCGESDIGIYPIVDSVEWLQKLLPLGVTTVQLRIKNKTRDALEIEIQSAVALAKKMQVRLFINDYWELALKYQAYGVHLGQEDLATADMDAIFQAGLRLGISTHGYYEVARAHAFSPSYIAIGPIFPTTTKPNAPAQGINTLRRWGRMLTCPVVAIGGIQQQDILDMFSAGAKGVAMIAAITQARDPIEYTQQLLKEQKRWQNYSAQKNLIAIPSI